MILVTGATGNVGSQVVQQLLEQGFPVRVLTRDPVKVARWGDAVEVAQGDFSKTPSFVAALEGVSAVFLMNGATDPTVFRHLVDTIRQNGRPRVVFLSSITVHNPNSPIGQIHKDKEEVLLASGLPVAFVRGGGFMSNALQWAGTIRKQGVVYNGMGRGQYAPVHPADLAAVAVHALTTPALSETAYDVTGDTLLDIPGQVRILAKVLGKPLRTAEITPAEAAQNLLRNGAPPLLAKGLERSMEEIRDGRSMLVTDAVQRVTGKPPRSFEQWVREHAAQFA
jgi:uncharacterized protein YbjT (DUF2867 family)